MSLDKRYQVFVSSTFEDLEPERAAIFKALMKGNFIPAGMEIWSAGTRTPLDRIKAEIDRSDFYVVVVAGRYGSENEQGVSYTELEYAYAKERGLNILAFIHSSPGDLKSKYVDTEPKTLAKLESFRERLKVHHVDHWSKAEDLGTAILAALHDDAAKSTTVGWIRADQASPGEALDRILKLEKENERLAGVAGIPDLADLSEMFTISGTAQHDNEGHLDWMTHPTWEGLWGLLAPLVTEYSRERDFKPVLAARLFAWSNYSRLRFSAERVAISQDLIETLRYHFIALGFTTAEHNNDGWWWSLTDKGHRALLAARAVRSDPDWLPLPDE